KHYLGISWVVPRSIFLLTMVLAIGGISASRLIWRMIRDDYRKMQPHHKRALIIGAGDAGTMVVKELKHTNSEFYPVAFIDDDQYKQQMEVLGVPVVGTRQMIPDVVEKYKIEHIIIALPSASRSEIADILEICK